MVATQRYFIFTPTEMIQFDKHIFQMVWFNHYLIPWVYPPPSNSGKWRFSSGSPILKMVHNPGGDWHPGRGVDLINSSYLSSYLLLWIRDFSRVPPIVGHLDPIPIRTKGIHMGGLGSSMGMRVPLLRGPWNFPRYYDLLKRLMGFWSLPFRMCFFLSCDKW